MLMEMEPLTKRRVSILLRKLFRVRRVTKDEHAKLNGMGLRSKMPDNWNRKDPWARYDAAGIICEKD
jgi:hypothetical protein